jgi:hypothetical protein
VSTSAYSTFVSFTMTTTAPKSSDDLAAERQKARDELDAILSKSRPKNLQQGMGRGVGNIVAGAVGAAGVAVMMPTLGLATGAKHGGILGAVVGVTGGAVVGVLGAAAIAVGGAFSGVSQIVQGVAAVPQQIIAPRQGKWWNETEGRWVRTDMAEEIKTLENTPADDSDLLGDVVKEVESSKDDELSGDVVDKYYYDILEVAPDADASAIKRSYYLLARKYHPDKCPNDEKAANKFKDVAEAYQVLSDPELRAKYNKDGKDGLSADKTSVADGGAPKIDPAVLFAFLFGSDKFTNYVGRLASATSAAVGDSPKISAKDARTLQKRRVTRLAIAMIAKIAPYVDACESSSGSTEALEAEWTTEAKELSEASYGHQLVTTIGQVYNIMAVMYEGSTESGQGLPKMSQWAAGKRAKMNNSKAANKNQMDTMKAGFDMVKLQSQLQQKMANAKSDEEKQEVAKELEESSVGILLRVLWTTTVVDITSTLHEMCHMIFYDQSVEAKTRKHRATAVKKLGEIWMEIPEPENGKNEEEKDAKALYEEATFAAMLETIKRKDDAAHGVS